MRLRQFQVERHLVISRHHRGPENLVREFYREQNESTISYGHVSYLIPPNDTNTIILELGNNEVLLPS